METEKIILEDGREIEIDNTPYFINNEGILYVFWPTGDGYNYIPMGRVKEQNNGR